jgi:predicted permease
VRLTGLRQAIRSVLRSPGASAVLILTVAVGVAACSTVFSLVDGLMLRPLAGVKEQSELVNVHATDPDGSTFHSVSFPTFRDLAAEQSVFSGLAAFSSRLVSLAGDGEPQLAVVQIVSNNFFDVLGSRPAQGRLFHSTEERAGFVVVLSHGAWTRRFGADPAIVGRAGVLNGRPFTVVGVTEPSFNGNFHGFPFDVWVPIEAASAVAPNELLEARRSVWLEMVGRLQPGMPLPAARAAMTAIAKRMERDDPETYRGVGYDLRRANGFEDSLRAPAISFFAVLSVLAGLVLAIACGNVSGILLARAVARERELSVRLALGAARKGLVRQLATEALLLFLAGGVIGSVLSLWTSSLLERFSLPTPIPITLDLSPGLRVLIFGLLLSAGAGLLFGTLAALPSTRLELLTLVRAGFSADRRGAARLRTAFVGAQMAMSVLLLVAAGLLLRTVRHAANADPGFAPDGLTTTRVDLSLLGYDTVRSQAFFERLVERASKLPHVESACVTGLLPLGPGSRTTTVRLPGHAEQPGVSVDFSEVGDGYFHTLRLPILRGRSFTAADAPGATRAAIVNETLARRLWPGQDPLGRSLSNGVNTLTVVGVAKDAKYRRLWEEPRSFLYVSNRQQSRAAADLVVKGGDATLAAAIRRELRNLEPALPLSTIRLVREYLGFSLLPQRVGGAVAGALGVAGLLLSAIGLAGLVAHSVSRRMREIGIRLAVGAQPADIVHLEMRRGMRVVILGALAGCAAALALAPLLKSLLFGVTSADPKTFAAVTALLCAIAALAAYLPARRAARIDPMAALRAE